MKVTWRCTFTAHPLEEAGVKPAFTMHHPEEQPGVFLRDMTHVVEDNLEVHLHDTPTRRG